MTDNNNLDDIEEDFSDFDNEEFEAGDEDFTEDGDEFVEEEWDSFDQDGEMGVDEPVGKKKSSLMFNLIIGLVALGGAGFVGMKFMGGAAPTANQPAQQQMAANGLNAAAQMPTANGQQDVTKTAQNNAVMPTPSTQAAQPSGSDFTPPPSDPELDFDMPMPFSNQAPVDTDTGEVPRAPQLAANDDLDMMASPSDDAMTAPAPAGFDSEPLTPLPSDEGDVVASGATGFDLTDDGGYPAPTAVKKASNAASSMSAGSDNDVVAAVESKIDQLFNRLDDIEARLDKSASSGASYDDSALKSSIAKLEKKVNALSDRLSSGSAPVQRSSSAPVRQKSVPAPAVSSSSSVTSKTWILTSAQPGKATIKKVGQDDVISIAVGDRVTGLGEIQSVRLIDGKWVVSATGGKIVQ